jgi:hypothetical protein
MSAAGGGEQIVELAVCSLDHVRHRLGVSVDAGHQHGCRRQPRHGKVVFQEGFRFAELEKNTRITPQTKIRSKPESMAHVPKPITPETLKVASPRRSEASASQRLDSTPSCNGRERRYRGWPSNWHTSAHTRGAPPLRPRIVCTLFLSASPVTRNAVRLSFITRTVYIFPRREPSPATAVAA